LLPRALGVGRLHAPQGRGGIGVAHEPHPAMVEAIEMRQRTRVESPGPGALPISISRRNLEAALDG